MTAEHLQTLYPLLLGTGGLSLGLAGLGQTLPAVRPRTRSLAYKFLQLPTDLPASDFVSEYARRGAALTRAPLLEDNPTPAGRIVSSVRTSRPFRALGALGVIPPTAGPDQPGGGSAAHYEAFEEGPVEAYRQMLRETVPRAVTHVPERARTADEAVRAVDLALGPQTNRKVYTVFQNKPQQEYGKVVGPLSAYDTTVRALRSANPYLVGGGLAAGAAGLGLALADEESRRGIARRVRRIRNYLGV